MKNSHIIWPTNTHTWQRGKQGNVWRSQQTVEPIQSPLSKTITRGLKKRLVRCCQKPRMDFERSYDMEGQDSNDGVLFFKDNGASILGVAHLDSVLFTPPLITQNIITCGQLDDRLGVWVLLHLLPHLGCPPFDILLTDNEEAGASTASWFIPPKNKEYDWIFSFDRAGEDAVTYQYEENGDDWEKSLREYFTIGTGTYSDIADMDFLECKGVNIGTGYHQQHSASCWADLNRTEAMARKFVDFATKREGHKFPHEKQDTVAPRKFHWERQYMNKNIGYAKDWDLICGTCRCDLEGDWNYCPYCGSDARDNHYL